MSGPLGTLPGMTFDPIRNRYFPTPKGPIVNPTEEDTRPLPSSGPSYNRNLPPLPPSRAGPSSSSRLGQPSESRWRGQYNISHPSSNSQHGGSRSDNQNSNQRGSGSYPQRSQEASARAQYRRSDHSYTQSQIPYRRNYQMRNFEQLTIPQPDCFAHAMKRSRSGSTSLDYGDKRMLDRVGRIRKGRFGIGYGGVGGQDRNLAFQNQILSNLELDVEHHACGCHGEIITSYKTFGDEAYYATTDHGKVIMHHKNGNTAIFSVCAQNLVGMHCDIPRLTMIAIAGGSEPHLHLFKRDPELLDHVFMTHSELDLHRAEIYGVSSFDDVCTLGGAKSLTTINYTSSLRSFPRRLQSDALAVHQTSRDLVFAGQRSGNVTLEDLRTSPRNSNIVASTLKGKAVVGVKRLQDSAVPWGLVVSGMSHEMLLFDVRYGDKPLKVFEGHFNTFHSSVALATSPDDKTLFASTSDRRIKAWSVISGEPLVPPTTQIPGLDDTPERDDNPLNRVYEHRVSHLDVNDELGLDVVVRGDLYRYGRK
ncbi:hypothetical protein I302_103269 [Kwoniella bestiolae CBS 10118]|uniref:WD-repeat protein n=1 Tax=Kwoniella bestiolae CBS 10118 TaxID=1296100 RepID=A0A1B9G803_9TREE|nr:hypothetical protein I302_01968 [Kwoniella bestiolae CBS 10118]OCF27133.1 hypothetical protein I302_01968 [Kwoniella bestiolae CBS 10118]